MVPAVKTNFNNRQGQAKTLTNDRKNLQTRVARFLRTSDGTGAARSRLLARESCGWFQLSSGIAREQTAIWPDAVTSRMATAFAYIYYIYHNIFIYGAHSPCETFEKQLGSRSLASPYRRLVGDHKSLETDAEDARGSTPC